MYNPLIKIFALTIFPGKQNKCNKTKQDVRVSKSNIFKYILAELGSYTHRVKLSEIWAGIEK